MNKYLNYKTCILAVVAVLVAVYIFKVQWNVIFTLGLLLLCPLMHVFMMKGMGHDGKSCHEDKKPNTIK
jgi:hypothetical protein